MSAKPFPQEAPRKPKGLVLVMACPGCGRAGTTTAGPFDEVRRLAAAAGWVPGVVRSDDDPPMGWTYATICPECAADPATVERLDFRKDPA